MLGFVKTFPLNLESFSPLCCTLLCVVSRRLNFKFRLLNRQPPDDLDSMVDYGEDGDQADGRKSWCAGRQVMHGTISGYMG